MSHAVYDQSFRLAGSRHHQQREAPPDGARLGLLNLGSHQPKMKLRDYIAHDAPPPPPAVARPHQNFTWGMLLNDKIGDCVCAMMLHSIEDFHLDAGTRAPKFTDADAQAYYEAIGGYNPGDPSTDQGCDEHRAMEMWESGRLPRTSDGTVHQIAGTVAIDPTSTDEVKRAINEFDDVQCSVALPKTSQGQKQWQVTGDPHSDPDARPGSWGGHGVPAREYDADHVSVLTWAKPLLATWQFWTAYFQQSFVVVTKEMLSRTGQSPLGIRWDDLLSDLEKYPSTQPALKSM
jgi:hypothetical protein